MPVTFVSLGTSDPDVGLLRAFYDDLFVPGFPDEDERESFETLLANLAKVENGFYGKNAYHILLALDGGRPVAACISDYLAESNCAAIEYILVADDRRGEGIGRAIHDHAIEIAFGDARAAGQQQLNAVMIEVNDPYSAPPELDTVDPFARVMMWNHWGYERLRFPYQQPALSPGQSAIDYLFIAVKVFQDELRAGFPSSLARQLVIDYFVWANRFDAFDDDPFFREMTAYAAAVPNALLEPLDRYIGRTPHLEKVEINDPAAAEFALAFSIYSDAFQSASDAISRERLRARMTSPLPPDSRFHLWGLRAAPDAPIAGTASFLSIPGVGFLDFLVLEPSLLGRGLAPVALKQIEEALFRDRSDIKACFVGCRAGSEQEAMFRQLGFRDTARHYESPKRDEDEAGRLKLLRKRLGDPLLLADPGAEDLDDEIRTITAALSR